MLGLIWKLATGGMRKDMLDNMLAFHDDKLRHLPGVVPAPAGAPRRNSFTASIPYEEMSLAQLSFAQRRTLMPTMMKLMWSMNKSAGYYQVPVANPRTKATPAMLEALEAAAREEGAAQIRYVTLTDDCLFGDLGVPHRHAIVYTVRMDKAAMDSAPSFECFHEVAKGYLRLARVGNRVTELLRAQGVAAYPGTALGGLTDYCRVAERAGLGTIGYHGCLISEEGGALLRLNTIYTSLDNLPEKAGEPSGWIRDFCAMCRKCIRDCPPQAIYPEPKVLEDGRVQCIDTGACLDYFAAHNGCAICIDVCPFSQSGYEQVKRKFKGNDNAPKLSVFTMR